MTQPTDDEWKDALRRFEILRTQRLSTGTLADLAERCETFALSARDLAFEMAARDTNPPSPEQAKLASAKKRFDLAYRRVGAAEQSSVIFQRLQTWDVDASIRSVARWLIGGSHLRFDAHREQSQDIWELAVLFRKLAEELRWESRMCGAAARRSLRSSRAGKPPRVEAIVLLEWAAERRVGIREVAQRLVAAGVLPDSKVDLDPVELWEGQLKAIRRRRRQQ